MVRAAIIIPHQLYSNHKSIAKPMARYGLFTSLIAVAAGPTKSVKIRSTPTTWTAIETVIATRIRKRIERNLVGTPLAVATSGSNELNSKRRKNTVSVQTVRKLKRPVIITFVVLIPSMVPKRIL